MLTHRNFEQGFGERRVPAAPAHVPADASLDAEVARLTRAASLADVTGTALSSALAATQCDAALHALAGERARTTRRVVSTLPSRYARGDDVRGR